MNCNRSWQSLSVPVIGSSGNPMRKGEFEFSIFWNLCEKIPWENLTVEAMHAVSDHPRPQRPLCQPTRRPVALWGCTIADIIAIVCEIFRRQITMDLMHWRIMTQRLRLKYTQIIIITTLSPGKWVRDSQTQNYFVFEQLANLDTTLYLFNFTVKLSTFIT